MSEIGILIHHHLLDSGLAEDWLREIPVKLWIVLRQYVKEGEKLRGQNYYGVAFKKIAELGLVYWLDSHKHLSAELIIYHPNPGDSSKSKKLTQARLREILEEIRKDLRDFGWLK